MITEFRHLQEQDLPTYSDHLKRLTPEDRHKRFGCPLHDEGIDRIVAGLRSDDEVHGLFRDGRLVAAVLVAYTGSAEAEVALSVEPDYRRAGLGHRLFDHGLAAARSRGIRRIVTYCLATNAAVMRIVRAAGMIVAVESGEGRAWVEIA
jgi:GNAT superfamily N-acetyltransferase